MAAVAVAACSERAAVRRLARHPLYAEAFTGILIRDADTGEVVYERNADRLFTPASNVKILTLATALACLPADSLPALSYRYDGDTLRIWGLAYPMLAADTLAYNARIRERLSRHPGPVEISTHRYAALRRFGSGWMWDDYGYAFNPERSGLPVYANLARAVVTDTGISMRPDYLVPRHRGRPGGRRMLRGETSNGFLLPPEVSPGDTLYAPLYAAQAMAQQLLEDWTSRRVVYHNQPLPSDWGDRVWRGQPRDSLLVPMMHRSDNFLAEHLLLQAGLYHADHATAFATIQAAKQTVLPAPARGIVWVDGSGLSHYNLASPRMITAVLGQLERRLGPETAERYFPNDILPYVHAKTGTLRHNHSLSGYLTAASGRRLHFSLMHNHFTGSSTRYREAMRGTLAELHDAL